MYVKCSRYHLQNERKLKVKNNWSLDFRFGFLGVTLGRIKIGHLGFQFSDFQLKSFMDPKPVEL